MIDYIIKLIAGSKNDRFVKSLRPIVQKINSLEEGVKSLSDEDLKNRTNIFKERLSKGETLDDILPEAFATVREAGRRVLNMRHFDVQLIGGMVLHRGMIAEMRTGEGKTLVATLAAYLNALTGKGVHVVTVNDYLARRDSEWMGQIYRFLGLTVGVVYSGMDESLKQEAYKCDITYGQNNEFGFDYLRDNLRYSAAEKLQRGHNFAIVDEVDSILIDEARTPLIISGPAEDSTELYAKINKIIPKLIKDEDYEIELKTKNPTLTEAGIGHAEELLKIDNLFDPKNTEIVHHINQALRAHTTMERDVDYVVKNGEVIIVDEFTGRLMPGRRWSNGLHQAVEAKEGVGIRRENRTLASITFQNLFRMYDKLSGMTGTALTEADEFKQIYNLEVIVIPTNMPMIRQDLSDAVFRTRREKYQAVADDIKEIHETGQPVLVGTISIEQSEALSRELQANDIPHSVLNAKYHEREAEIVAQAGRFGAVTIATNMAGRGTDITLGGNAEFLAANETGTRDEEDPKYQEALKKYIDVVLEEKEKVREAGGLFILGTERHESRRIDNQLRGRAGRQGDPGQSKFYVSLEDDLMMRFGGEKIQKIMTTLGWEEGVAMDGRMISRSIRQAQERVERYHFDSRKHVTEYDNVMNKQRQVIYNLRNRVLLNDDISGELKEMLDDILENAVLSHTSEDIKPNEWNVDGLNEYLMQITNLDLNIKEKNFQTQQELYDYVCQVIREAFNNKLESLAARLKELESLTFSDGSKIPLTLSQSADKPFDISTIEQDTILEALDYFWNQHLQNMEYLRDGIGLRGYGQLNPLYEYQKEGFILFQGMLSTMKENVIRRIFFYEIPEPQVLLAQFEAERKRREEVERQIQMSHSGRESEGGAPELYGPRDPNAAKAKRLQQKKARRKK